jgi:hypothetical protein
MWAQGEHKIKAAIEHVIGTEDHAGAVALLVGIANRQRSRVTWAERYAVQEYQELAEGHRPIHRPQFDGVVLVGNLSDWHAVRILSTLAGNGPDKI